jgi:DNA-binding transcriptional ArsR family regulator
VDVFTALADPVRRSLLRAVAGSPQRVVDLAEAFPISRPAVSKHLRLLVEAGLVEAEQRGRERHYALRRDGLRPVTAYVAALQPPLVTERALDALETEVRRTTRERRRSRPEPRSQEETA